MNEGYVAYNGEYYIKYEIDAEGWAMKRGYKDLQEAYDDDAIYYTAWEEEADYEYVLVNDKLVEIEQYEVDRAPINELSEKIQNDIIAYMDGFDVGVVDALCQIVADRLSQFRQ